MKPVHPRATCAHTRQLLGQPLGRIGIEPIRQHPHPCVARELRACMYRVEVGEAGRDTRAAAETRGDGVDLFLYCGRVAAQQRRDLRKACVEHEYAGVQGRDEGTCDAQKELRVRFHRTADVDQDEEARPFAARRTPDRVHRQAAGAQARTQGAAHVEPAAVRIVVPAARQALAQPARDLLGQALQQRKVLRQPLRQTAVVQGIGARRAALSTLQRPVIVDGQWHIECGVCAAGARRRHAAVHAVVQALHHLLQIAARPGWPADLGAPFDTLWIPVAFEQLGPALPVARVVTGDGTPCRIEPGCALDRQSQRRLYESLLLANADFHAVVAQQRRKAGDAFEGARERGHAKVKRTSASKKTRHRPSAAAPSRPRPRCVVLR